jgi:hypothetical protein
VRRILDMPAERVTWAVSLTVRPARVCEALSSSWAVPLTLTLRPDNSPAAM